MKYALINNQKTQPGKGATGTCPNCGSVVIAKCGDIKIDHWAHKGLRKCDTWWENETAWHRKWKGQFESDWQEYIFKDEVTGEKHIADVRSEHGLVVEFQHSFINATERNSREAFYKKMIWIVDGTRLKKDFERFSKGLQNFRTTETRGAYWVNDPEESFPNNWLNSKVPVIFDFKGTEEINEPKDIRHYLFYLFPKETYGRYLVVFVERDFIINGIKTDQFFKTKEELEKQSTPTIKNQSAVRQEVSPYFYDTSKGKFVKRRRL